MTTGVTVYEFSGLEMGRYYDIMVQDVNLEHYDDHIVKQKGIKLEGKKPKD